MAMDELSLPQAHRAPASLDLMDVAHKLQEYNKNTGWGPTTARIVAGVFKQLLKSSEHTEANNDQRLDRAVTTEISHRENTREHLQAELTPLVAPIGLSVGPINGGWSLHGHGEAIDPSALSLHIEDANLLTTYLAGLEPTTTTESQLEGLRFLYRTLCRQVTTDYDLSASDDRLLGLVSGAKAMVTHYNRLGLEVDRLENYLTAIQGRYLRSYVNAENLQLTIPLKKGDGFRLLWHRDATPTLVQNKWNAVLDALHDLSCHDDAEPIYKAARQTATEAIAKSLAEVSAWEPNAGDSRLVQKDTYLQILRSVQVRLRDF